MSLYVQHHFIIAYLCSSGRYYLDATVNSNIKLTI